MSQQSRFWICYVVYNEDQLDGIQSYSEKSHNEDVNVFL